MNKKLNRILIVIGLLLIQPLTANARPDSPRDIVYTLSNAELNEVLAFRLTKDGEMQPAGNFATGGAGTASGLGNQGALAFSASERYLFAVNAGSNDVSVFRVRHSGLELIDRASEDGLTPVSIAVSHHLVYVVNTGDDSIFGFRFDERNGKLFAMPDSYRKLSGTGTSPAQISFNREGDALVVTEKASNKITSFALDEQGLPEQQHVIDSAGVTPFGFAFGKRDQFFVSEAQGGAANAATVSSYELSENGDIRLIAGAVAVGQTAACWLATTPSGRIAFTADTPANAISAFEIDRHGHLTLLQDRAAEENLPTDLAVSDDGRRLYTLSGGDHSIGVYRIGPDGSLHKKAALGDLPNGVTGLAVR